MSQARHRGHHQERGIGAAGGFRDALAAPDPQIIAAERYSQRADMDVPRVPGDLSGVAVRADGGDKADRPVPVPGAPEAATPASPTARSTRTRGRKPPPAYGTRAQAFFAQAGITVERVLTDNGACYRSHDWRDTLAAAGITHQRTRPYRPQTNGKVEHFNRTLHDEWAYARPYQSEAERQAAFPQWLHTCNHHRGTPC